MASEEGAGVVGGAGGSPGSGAQTSPLSVVGENVRHVGAGQEAICHLAASAGATITKDNVDINILSPSKVPVSYRYRMMTCYILLRTERIYLIFPLFRLKEEGGVLSVLFKPLEVGTFVMDIYHATQKIGESPVFFKVPVVVQDYKMLEMHNGSSLLPMPGVRLLAHQSFRHP